MMFEITLFIIFVLLIVISAFFVNLPTKQTAELATTVKLVSKNDTTPTTLFTDLTDEDIKRATVGSIDVPDKEKPEIIIALIDESIKLLESIRILTTQFIDDRYFENQDNETSLDITKISALTETYISEAESRRTKMLSNPSSMTQDFDSLRVIQHLHLLKVIAFYQDTKISINDISLIRKGRSEDEIVKYQAGELLNIIKIYIQSIATAGYSKHDYFNNLRPLLFDFAIMITCDGSTISPYNTRVINEVFSSNWSARQCLNHYESLQLSTTDNANNSPERGLANFLLELQTLKFFALIDFYYVIEFFLFHFAASEPESDSSDNIIFRFSNLHKELCQAHN